VLLESFVDAARAHNGAHRTEVGQPWAFEAARSVEATLASTRKGGAAKLAVTDEPGRKVVTPDRIGRYQVVVDSDKMMRVVAPAERELDLRPHPLAANARSSSLGDVHARFDLSPYLAAILLT